MEPMICSKCGKEIFEVNSRLGRIIQIEIAEDDNGTIEIDETEKGALIARMVGLGNGSYISHFARCGRSQDANEEG